MYTGKGRSIYILYFYCLLYITGVGRGASGIIVGRAGEPRAFVRIHGGVREHTGRSTPGNMDLRVGFRGMPSIHGHRSP